ncbi:MAG: RuBisCO large subunit C-terminal-like domain-containing protein [Anaerolineaceae bacterium]
MSKYRTQLYSLYEGINKDDFVIATYITTAETKDFMRLAGEIAAEQTTGSWLPIPLETPEVMEKHGARVLNAFEVPDYTYEVPEGKRKLVMEIAFPMINFGAQIPMLLSTVIGNISMMGDMKLIDLKFPEKFVKAFPGPQFGIEGMRKYLNAPKRPLLNNMIKPCTGLTPEQTGNLFYEVAVGGVDVVKDDELIANPSFSSVVDRVKECMKAEKRAYEETGEHTYYATNITDSPSKILENARAAVEAGTNMLMINTLTAGWGSLQMIAEAKLGVPILSHPDYSGVLSWSERGGLSATLTLGKFIRMCGADISVYPTPYGKLPINLEQTVKVLFTLQEEFYGLKPIFPMPSGGLTQGMVKVVMDDMGWDIILGAGAAIHAHPMGSTAGAKAFRHAIDGVMAGKTLREIAKESKELKIALDAWGVTGEEEKDIFGLKQ